MLAEAAILEDNAELGVEDAETLGVQVPDHAEEAGEEFLLLILCENLETAVQQPADTHQEVDLHGVELRVALSPVADHHELDLLGSGDPENAATGGTAGGKLLGELSEERGAGFRVQERGFGAGLECLDQEAAVLDLNPMAHKQGTPPSLETRGEDAGPSAEPEQTQRLLHRLLEAGEVSLQGDLEQSIVQRQEIDHA